MRAFAAAHTRAPLDDDLHTARPAYAGEYDYLHTHWPELTAFLADHPLEPHPTGALAGLPRARALPRPRG